MKIKVIGAGWYGCHLALSLLNDGHDVTVFEKADHAFAGASGANQSRTHLGFHYPRCHKTRLQALDGYREFMRRYDFLTKAVPTNVYAVAAEKSLVDFDTYRSVLSADGVEFVTLEPGDHDLKNIEGAILTGERVILETDARAHFAQMLKDHIRFGERCQTAFDPDYDLSINCTYGSLPTPGVARFQPCLLFVYEGPDDLAVTVMDGPHGLSLYPYWEPGKATLTSVRHTPLAECESWEEVEAVQKRLIQWDFDRIRSEMEVAALEFMPWFKSRYTAIGHHLSVRALPASLADRRTCHVYRDKNVLSVLPGKITGIFEAERQVKACLR